MKDRYIGLEDLEEINKQNNQMKKNKKIKKEKKSVFERFSTKENIIIFSFLLIFLILATALIKNYDPFNKIDYREENSETFLEEATRTYDRETYWILNDILMYFLYSNTGNNVSVNGEGSQANLYYKYSTVEYYEVLTNDYKTYLKEEGYLELANKVIANYKENYEVLVEASSEVPIRKVYKCDSLNGDYYLVRLNTSELSYIGIQLFKEDSKFKIFYLE